MIGKFLNGICYLKGLTIVIWTAFNNVTTETQNKILKFQIQKKLFQELNNISPKQFHMSMFFSKVVLPFGNTYLNKSLASIQFKN